MNCPNCKTASFVRTEYESVEINQCKSCHGVWLDQDALTQIIENRTVKFGQQDIIETISTTFAGMPQAEMEKATRECPICCRQLSPINYSYNSGIILDICSQGHGLWLDQGELEKIQQYREYWHDNIKENEQSITRLIEDIEEKPTQVGFQSLLFNLSIEISDIISKLKR